MGIWEERSKQGTRNTRTTVLERVRRKRDKRFNREGEGEKKILDSKWRGKKEKERGGGAEPETGLIEI